MLSSWKTYCSKISQRWIFVTMAFFAVLIGNALRIALSITIIEMTVPIAESEIDDTCSNIERPLPKNITFDTGYRYDWDEYTQGIILSSYFWGYTITQFPSGFLAERYGGKHFLGLSNFIPAVLTFLTPLCVKYGGSAALIALRVGMGLATGALYPAAGAMLSKWSTTTERTKFGSIVYAGGLLGTACGMTISGLVIRYSSLGWPAVFYVFGTVGMVWFVLWTLLCYSNPREHPFISENELKYLEESLKLKRKPAPTPWRHILTSMESWAFVICMFGCGWTWYTMANDGPKYMNSVARFSIEDNGYLSSLPYLCAWLCSIFCFWLVDHVVKKQWLSLNVTRKLMITIALKGPVIFIIGASYAECDQVLVVVMFVVGMTFMGAEYPSIFVNMLDLSPNYSGTLMSIGNGVASLGGIFTPYIVGVLTPNQTIGEWRIVFWIAFAIATLSCMFFLVFGSTEIQPWNDPDFLKNEKTNKTANKITDSEIYL